MEAKYLKPPQPGVNEAGWYVLQEGKILYGPWSKERAEARVEAWLKNQGQTPNSPEPDDDGWSPPGLGG